MLVSSHSEPHTIMTSSLDSDARLIQLYPGMRLTTGFGPNALLVEPEIATFPVLLFIPLLIQQLRTIKHVEISTMAPIPSPFASSNTNTVNVLQQDIAKDNTEGSNIICSHSQLNPITFKPVTPIKANRFEELLKGHPNQDSVHCVITSFRQGFTLKYHGPKVNREPNNLKSACQFKEKLWASLMKEVHLGRMIGPFASHPITPPICSPVGMVEKKNSSDMHWATHLSYPKGSSINAFIHPADAESHYQTFEAAVNLVAKAGQGAFMAKEDFKSAFRYVPMAFSELNLLGVKVEGKYFIDCALPFGTSISCKIFKDVASLIHWIAEDFKRESRGDKRVGLKLVHYLDDFFTVHRLNMVCSNIMSVFKLVCDQIGMPVSPDKSEGPTQIIEFLGLTIDTIQMVVRIPKDKMLDITLISITIIRKRKEMAAELESLTDQLNFIAKAVPAGRSFRKESTRASKEFPNTDTLI